MKNIVALTALGLIAAATPLAARAASPGDVFLASINGASEVPSNGSTGVGFAQLTILTATDFQLIVSFSSAVSANTTAAHIHTGAPGVNGPVLIDLATAAFTGTRTITGTTTPSVNGTFTGQSAFITALNTGTHYLNFHNATFPGGEVRGNLVAAPEPGTLCLGLLGAGALGLRRRRKSRKGA